MAILGCYFGLYLLLHIFIIAVFYVTYFVNKGFKIVFKQKKSSHFFFKDKKWTQIFPIHNI